MGGKQWIVVRKGKGGRRAVGLYQPEDWYKEFGTRFLVLGVSGALYKGYDSESKGWEVLNHFFPGVVDAASLARFHASIPHTETNLSPTHSHMEEAPYHRAGAVAYTFCEQDSTEMLEARMAVTLKITGKEDGVIDKREYYNLTKFVPPSENTTAKGDVNKDDNNRFTHLRTEDEDNMDTEDVDDEFTHSQELYKALDLKNGEEGSQAADKAITSPKKRKVDEELTDNDAICNIKTKGSVETQLVALALPKAACLFDAKTFTNKFKAEFGLWHADQVQLAQFAPFQGCWSAIIECPISMVTDFMTYAENNFMFGKYKCQTMRVANPEQQIQYLAVNDSLEALASDFLVQYVKHATHPKHDEELEQQLLIMKNGTQLLQYYHMYWVKDGNFQDSKAPANPIVVPEPTPSVAGSEEEELDENSVSNIEDVLVDFQQGQDLFP